MLNPEIFRQYDIRGVAGKDMNEDDVEQLGKGIGTYLARQSNTHIAVGKDCRAASDRMKMKGVHCQISAMMTEAKAQLPSDSQGIGSRPRFFSVRLKIPTVG